MAGTTFRGSNHGWSQWNPGTLTAVVDNHAGDSVVQIVITSGPNAAAVNLSAIDAAKLAAVLEYMGSASATGVAPVQRRFMGVTAPSPARRPYRAIDASALAADFAADHLATVRVRIGDPLTMNNASLAAVDLPLSEARRLGAHLERLVRTLNGGTPDRGIAS